MAINSLILQPADLVAAYRPIVFRVAAERTDGNPVPPVVYCDIYFAGIYYKTLSRTQYESTSLTESVFLFDISDAAQEYLRQQLPVNGGVAFISPSSVFTECYCKFRSTGYDADGFLTPEDTAPVQGTGSQDPVSGTGTQSDTFTIINASLQHEDSQDLQTHLKSFRTGSWDPDAMPLTHRPSPYKVCRRDSDYYPFVDMQDRSYTCLKLYYKLKGDAGFTSAQDCACVPVALYGSLVVPDAETGVPWSLPLTFVGTLPLIPSDFLFPEWITSITLVGNVFTFGGTPVADGPVYFSFKMSNDCGDVIVENAEPPECIASAVEDVALPDAIVDEAYSFDAAITGTAPFTLGSVTKPAWMTIAIVGSNVHFSGTPTVVAGPADVTFEVTNCSPVPSIFDHTVEVVEEPPVAHSFLVKISDEEVDVCGAGVETTVWSTDTMLDDGSVIYADEAMTTFVASGDYFSDLSELNPTYDFPVYSIGPLGVITALYYSC